MMMLRGDDGELREYEVVSTRERESVFQRACPVLPVALAVICCLLNIVPGIVKIIRTIYSAYISN